MRVWLRIGLLSFGGPAAQIAMLHKEVVETRGWVSEQRFLLGLSFCTLLPGPEAMQLATYLGWLMHGVRGGITAGLLFVLPGAAVMMGLSILFATLGQVPQVAGLFYGLKCAVLALVAQAVWRIGRRALRTPVAWLVALTAFVALFLFAVPYPLLVLAAGALGAAWPAGFFRDSHPKQDVQTPGPTGPAPAAGLPGLSGKAGTARRAGAAAIALCLVPVAALQLTHAGVFADIAWFFSKMAVLTLGGAYAVLAYVAQDAVRVYRWLSPTEMLAGLGLAETTPGPLILVLEFVGFLAGYRAPGPLPPVLGGIVAALLTLWVTFLPCFAFVFLGAPSVAALAENRLLAGALASVTAAVVGVIANLALWFGLHAAFAIVRPAGSFIVHTNLPDLSSLDPMALLLACSAAVCLFRLRWPVPLVLALSALAGALHPLL
jgi:chromate transporter